jgi:flagellar biosynthesis protein FlhG
MQATVQGDSAALAKTYPHVIAVTSGKGGVGKSSISVNLGIALSRMGHKVCLFDADAGLANVNILLGLSPVSSLEHVVLAHKPVRSIMLDAPYGMKVIPGASGIVECADMSPRHQMHMTRELASIEREYDYLLIDTAAGIGESNLNFIQSAQHTIVVITPEPTSLTDAFSLIKVLRRRGKKDNYRVVVNMCSNTKQAREVYHRFAGAVEKYIGVTVEFLGYILQDESIRSAVTMQSPVTLFPETDPSCRHFFRLGEVLDKSLQNSVRSTVFSRRWQKLVRQIESRKSQQAATGKPEKTITGVQLQSPEVSFANLRTRLLTLIAQGDVAPEEIRQLGIELDKALSRIAAPDKPAHIDPPKEQDVPRYDVSQFGSQEVLLQRLRANRDASLAELLSLDHDS